MYVGEILNRGIRNKKLKSSKITERERYLFRGGIMTLFQKWGKKTTLISWLLQSLLIWDNREFTDASKVFSNSWSSYSSSFSYSLPFLAIVKATNLCTLHASFHRINEHTWNSIYISVNKWKYISWKKQMKKKENHWIKKNKKRELF